MKTEKTQDLREQLLNSPDVRDQIARRAYEIFEHRGHAQGQELQDWIQAENEILGGLMEAARAESAAGRSPGQVNVPAAIVPKTSRKGVKKVGATKHRTPRKSKGPAGLKAAPVKESTRKEFAKSPSRRSSKKAAGIKSEGEPQQAIAQRSSSKPESTQVPIARKTAATAGPGKGLRRSQPKSSSEP
jgi:hypothetical protein